jgi:hypothetical protein
VDDRQEVVQKNKSAMVIRLPRSTSNRTESTHRESPNGDQSRMLGGDGLPIKWGGPERRSRDIAGKRGLGMSKV